MLVSPRMSVGDLTGGGGWGWGAGKLGGSGQRVEMFNINGQRKEKLLLKKTLGQWVPFTKLQMWRIRFQLEQERGQFR